ncbi:MAG: hypothetical protein AVDCRST_MAG77-1454, partial [uncultured Chloroflexi bacterium]
VTGGAGGIPGRGRRLPAGVPGRGRASVRRARVVRLCGRRLLPCAAGALGVGGAPAARRPGLALHRRRRRPACAGERARPPARGGQRGRAVGGDRPAYGCALPGRTGGGVPGQDSRGAAVALRRCARAYDHLEGWLGRALQALRVV